MNIMHDNKKAGYMTVLALLMLLVILPGIRLTAKSTCSRDGSNPGIEEKFKSQKPLVPVVQDLVTIFKQKGVKEQFDAAIKNVKNLPPKQGDTNSSNPWCKRTSDEFINYFNNWYDFLADPDTGLGYIEPFTYFYYDNQDAFDFLNKNRAIFDWTVKFIKARGKFMDTPNSRATDVINQWINSPGTHIEDYVIPVGGYRTFNDFFTRDLKPGARPISAVDDDSVVVAPADSELNMLNSILTESSKIKTKGTQKLGVKRLLNDFWAWRSFIYGNALSCVLLPSNYHHYHAPVSGKLIHWEIVDGLYNGIKDAPQWFHEGNVGDSDADFSIFEQFHRGIFIFETEKFGYVAMVVVGLNTISDIGFERSSVNTLAQYKTASRDNPVQVFKGDKLGYFKYGGSLNILLFQKGVFEGVKVHQGQRIGTMNPPAQ